MWQLLGVLVRLAVAASNGGRSVFVRHENLEKHVELQIGLCEAHLRQRHWAALKIAGLILFALFVAFPVALILVAIASEAGNAGIATVCAVVGLVGLVVSMLLLFGKLTRAWNVLAAERIDDYFAWLRGAGPEFLASCPEFSQDSAPLLAIPVAARHAAATPPSS